MDADLQNLAFCLAMWAVPIGTISLSNFLDRKAARGPKPRGAEPSASAPATGAAE